EDIREGALDSEIWPAMYIPFNQSPDTFYSVVVRTSVSEQSMLPAAVEAVDEIDRGIVTLEERTMHDQIGYSPTAYLHRSSAWLVGGFAAVSFSLNVGWPF